MFSCWFLFGEPFVRCQTKEGKLTKLAVPCCCVFPSILFVANHLFSILFRILLLALCLLCSLENAFESFTSDQLRRIILKKKFSGRHPRSLPMDEVGNDRRLICIFDCVRRGGQSVSASEWPNPPEWRGSRKKNETAVRPLSRPLLLPLNYQLGLCVGALGVSQSVFRSHRTHIAGHQLSGNWPSAALSAAFSMNSAQPALVATSQQQSRAFINRRVSLSRFSLIYLFWC